MKDEKEKEKEKEKKKDLEKEKDQKKREKKGRFWKLKGNLVDSQLLLLRCSVTLS